MGSIESILSFLLFFDFDDGVFFFDIDVLPSNIFNVGLRRCDGSAVKVDVHRTSPGYTKIKREPYGGSIAVQAAPMKTITTGGLHFDSHPTGETVPTEDLPSIQFV